MVIFSDLLCVTVLSEHFHLLYDCNLSIVRLHFCLLTCVFLFFRKYNTGRSTLRFGIAYFVLSDFNDKYPSDSAAFRRVEAQVEDEHVSNLQYHCYRERSHRKYIDSVIATSFK